MKQVYNIQYNDNIIYYTQSQRQSKLSWGRGSNPHTHIGNSPRYDQCLAFQLAVHVTWKAWGAN